MNISQCAAGNLPLCLNLTAHVDHRFGGLTTSVPDLSDALISTGRYNSKLLAFCDPGETIPERAGATKPAILPAGRFHWFAKRSLRNQLLLYIQSADVVHAHGLWQEQSHFAAVWARRCRKPLLVSAHGMLDPWALRASRLKKALYWNALEKTNLQRAACLRALTAVEAQQYRDMGLRAPIAVIPNGVFIPDEISPDAFHAAFPHLKGVNLLLFLGRIHVKKGLDVLLQAWRKVHSAVKDAHLVIAGPPEDEVEPMLREFVAQNALSHSVTFTGMLRGELKWAALAAAKAFVLPSYSEGFSVAVLEALAAGTPVVITKQCYFPEVSEYQCGWVIDPQVNQIEFATAEALTQNAALRCGMGVRGRELARHQFSWSAIGQKTAEILDWIRNGRQPANVQVFA